MAEINSTDAKILGGHYDVEVRPPHEVKEYFNSFFL